MKKKTLLILTALFTMTLGSCGAPNFYSIMGDDDFDDGEVKTKYQEYDNGKRVTAINLDKTSEIIDITSETTSFQLHASIEPSDAYNKDLTYSTDNPNVATVSDEGLVTGVGNGTAYITVSSDNNITNSCMVNVVTPVTGISISPHSPDSETTGHIVDIYERKQFIVNYLPADTNETGVTWKVVDEEGNKCPFASISEAGLLTVNGPKSTPDIEAYVVATSTFDDSITSREKITIRDTRTYATGVKLLKVDGQTKTDISGTTENPIVLNTSIQLEGEKIPAETTSDKYTWKVQDASVLSITDNGVITALKEGSTTVTVEIDDQVASAEFVVTKIPVTSVSLNATEKALKKGETFTLVPTVAPADASIKTVVYEVTNGQDVIDVDPITGVVTAKASGTGTVLCKSIDDNTKSATCSFTVTNAVESITIEDPFGTEDHKLPCSAELQLTYVTEPLDPDAYTVTWTSSNTQLATVSPDGLVVVNDDDATGNVTITLQVVGTEISDTITFDVVGVFQIDKEYLVGNRSFAAGSYGDFTKPSWESTPYALMLEDANEGKQDIYEQQWVAKNVVLNGWDGEAEESQREEFRIRGFEWHDSCACNPAETNLAKPVDGTFNYKVNDTDQYNIYFQKLTAYQAGIAGVDYYIYVEKSFSNNSYYFVGNKDYSTGTSKDTGESWHDISKALVMTHNPSPLDPSYEEYQATVTLLAGDQFKIRNNNFFNIDIESGSVSGISKQGEGDMYCFVCDVAGTYAFTFKQKMGEDKLYIGSGEQVAPTGISLNRQSAFVLDNGTSTTLVANIEPTNCTYKDVEWISSNPEVIKVEGSGTSAKLTALKDSGTSTITARINNETYHDIKTTVDVSAKPFNFAWGVASNTSGWEFDGSRTLAQTDTPIGINAYAAYKANLTFEDGELWKIKSNDGQWINNNVGSDSVYKVGYDDSMSTVKNVFTIADDGNIETIVGGTYEINLIVYKDGIKDESQTSFIAGMSIFAKEAKDKPITEIEWGVAGSNTQWSMGQKFTKLDEVPLPYTADKAFKIDDIQFATDELWKVRNNNDEWISNAPASDGYAGVGIDLENSTTGAFERTKTGDVKVLIPGHYEILLLEYTSAVAKNGVDYYSGYQIVANKIENPEPPAATHTITYFVPDQEDSSFLSFKSSTIEVNDGVKLSEALNGKATNFGDFQFKNWSSSRSFTDNCNEVLVHSDMTVYAQFERDNVLYYYDGTSAHFLTSAPTSDVTIDDMYHHYAVGTQIFGKNDYLAQNDKLREVELGTTSGVYKFKLDNGNWTCERKFNISTYNVTWWPSQDVQTVLHLWGQGMTDKDIVIPSSSFVGNLTTVYVDAGYIDFMLMRKSLDGKTIHNQTVDAKFTSPGARTEIYGKDHLTFYIEDGQGSLNYSWY